MKRIIFFSLLIVYLILFLFKKMEYDLGLASAYVADLIAVPFILILLNEMMVFLYGNRFNSTLFHVFVIVISLSLTFELILPRYSTLYYSDFFDVCCYVVGGIFSYFFLLRTKILEA